MPELFLVLRWVYRNPYSILDPAAVDSGKGSRNGSVNSFTSDVPRSYQPRLRYNHMATLAHLPNGSIAAQWQVHTWQTSVLCHTAMQCWPLSDKFRPRADLRASGATFTSLLSVCACIKCRLSMELWKAEPGPDGHIDSAFAPCQDVYSEQARHPACLPLWWEWWDSSGVQDSQKAGMW